jgi:hypothetical protein
MTIMKDASQDKFHVGTSPSELAAGLGLGGNQAPVPGFQDYDTPLKKSLGARYTSITQKELKAHAGNAFSKPTGRCQVLMNGFLRLLPSEPAE